MTDINSSTPYDDVFRTLLNDCTSLIIPVVNEIFGEHYTGKETIQFLPNEHFINRQDANTKEKITDSCFQILSNPKKKYHIECQSTTDNHKTIRMFEYASQIALEDCELSEDELTVTFPHSAVLYLRHTRSTPDSMIMKIRTPGGNVSYEIPVLKVQQYTLDELFEKKLLFLIPFYIFSFEHDFPKYELDSEKLVELKKEFLNIRNRLENASVVGEINEYVKCTIIDMSQKVIGQITTRYANIRKEVTSVMKGKILEYEAKTILQRGIREGRLEGIREGKIEGYAEIIRDGLLTVEEAAKRLGMKEEELKKYL